MIKLNSHKWRSFLNHSLSSSFSKFNKRQFYDQINQSMYYRPRIAVSQFLSSHNISFRESDKSIRIKECRFCNKHHYNDMSNLFSLTLDKITGVFHCFRCDASGSWMSFKKKYLDIDETDIASIMSDELYQRGSSHPINELSDVEYMLYIHNLSTPEHQDTRQYLKGRGFTEQTIKKYKIGAGIAKFANEDGQFEDVKVIYFPMFRIVSQKKDNNQTEKQIKKEELLNVTVVKTKLKGASKQTKKYLRQYPSGPGLGLFGLNTIKQSDTTIVITEGQFDAMAVHQQTKIPAISLPLGANSFPDGLVMMLNQFEKIILWMDNDQAGQLGSEKIAYKLGLERTHVVKNQDPKFKDANDFLLKCPEKMSKLLEKSKSKPDENIMTFADLKQSVRNRIFKNKQFEGIKIDWLPFFNRKIKGIRMQQLSIFSGPTGSGKTTFLSQLTLDLCKKGVPILWGSFEIRNQILLSNMLIQYSEVNLIKQTEKFEHFSQSFQKLPLYYLSFHGSTKSQKALDIIEYAIEKHNISVVVVDTLQFFLSGQAEGAQKFDLQDKVMSSLRNIATKYKVHIIVVIHPRKIDESEDIQINSIYGSSKATQEADNIWILQNRDSFRILDVKKNRFDGELGKIGVGFDKETKNFVQLNKNQITHLYNKNSTMEEIMNKRNKRGKTDDQSEHFILETQEDQNFTSKDMLQKPKFPKKRYP